MGDMPVCEEVVDLNRARWTFQDPTGKVFLDIVKRLKKAAKYKRKRRHGEVECVVTYFDDVITKSELITRLEDFVDQVLEACISVSETLYQLLQEDEDGDIIQLTKKFSALICVFLEHLKGKQNSVSFLEQTMKLHKFYLDVAINNPDSWTYVLTAGGPMELISLSIHSLENKQHWINFYESHMLGIHKSITSCGDFECQRSLLVFLINWLENVPTNIKYKFILESFCLISRQYRESLFKDFGVFDADYKSRYFLNHLNRALMKSHRPSSVFSISCRNVFLEGERIQPAIHPDITEFWIDFSCKSKRIHFYCSFPTEEEHWQNISVHKKQIDSVCVFYPTAPIDNEMDLTMTQFSSEHHSNEQNNSIGCYVHLILKSGFDNFCEDPNIGKNKRSLVFEFDDAEKVEEVLSFFQLDAHECDMETYQKLVPTSSNRDSPGLSHDEEAPIKMNPSSPVTIEKPSDNLFQFELNANAPIIEMPSQPTNHEPPDGKASPFQFGLNANVSPVTNGKPPELQSGLFQFDSSAHTTPVKHMSPLSRPESGLSQFALSANTTPVKHMSPLSRPESDLSQFALSANTTPVKHMSPLSRPAVEKTPETRSPFQFGSNSPKTATSIIGSPLVNSISSNPTPPPPMFTSPVTSVRVPLPQSQHFSLTPQISFISQPSTRVFKFGGGPSHCQPRNNNVLNIKKTHVPCYKRALPKSLSPEPADPYDLGSYCHFTPKKKRKRR